MLESYYGVTELSVEEWEAEAQRLRDRAQAVEERERLAANAISDTEREENEWRALEEARSIEWSWKRGGHSCGVKYSDKPHPDSYGAHLPMRSELDALAKLTRTTSAERNSLAARPLQLTPCDNPPRHSSHQMSGPAAIERAHKRFAELSILPLI